MRCTDRARARRSLNDVYLPKLGNGGYDALHYDLTINYDPVTNSETMEYTNGVMEMFRIADEWGRDRQRPTSELVPGHGTYPGPVDVIFGTSEPATVYYTTDGSRPTVYSPRYEATEFREPGETFHVTETTTFRWFSVDTAGNVERGYDPDRPATRGRFREATITIGDT
jgi:Chitobiase/beta-hexosaminidase C-terminal domain